MNGAVDAMTPTTPSWAPFVTLSREQLPQRSRPIESPEGIGDRLRAAAFAEIQAREAFLWAANRFTDAPEPCRNAWRGLAHAEDRHLSWLLRRLQELGQRVDEKQVSDHLWVALTSCQAADEFAHLMARAEDRGRQAGERFCAALKKIDPISGEIFGKIAEEEIEHIRLADRYFPQSSFKRA